MVVARESITYNAVKEVCSKVFLAPDPAFFMQAQKCELDERFKDSNVVGINISPMIISNETNVGVTYENYKKNDQLYITEYRYEGCAYSACCMESEQ